MVGRLQTNTFDRRSKTTPPLIQLIERVTLRRRCVFVCVCVCVCLSRRYSFFLFLLLLSFFRPLSFYFSAGNNVYQVLVDWPKRDGGVRPPNLGRRHHEPFSGENI